MIPLYEFISSALILIALFVVGSCLWHEKHARISPTPVLPWVRRNALQLMMRTKDIEAAHKIADLGAGWGGMLAVLAHTYKHAEITGFEISPFPLLMCRLRAWFSGGRFGVRKSDFFAADLSEYDILYCYLSPSHMRALIPQFQSMKAGSIVVSCSFAIPDWTPKDMILSKGLVDIPVYVYEI